MAKRSLITNIQLEGPAADAIQVLGPDIRRTGVLFLAPGVNKYTVSPIPHTYLDYGLNLNTSSTPVLLKYDDVGDIVQKAWYGVSDAVKTPLGIIEIIEVD